MLIRGLVADADGKPISWATAVFMEGPVALPDIAAVTDDAGRFTVAAPAPGAYRVGFHAVAFEPAEVTVTVGDSDVDVECRLQPVADGPDDVSGGSG